MAGTINIALSQQFDTQGRPLSGGLLYFYAAGTTTPQTAYQDTDLSIPHPNPIELDSSGRVPMFYLADGDIKIRLTDDAGVTLISQDNLLVIGPSSGSGGGSSVDATKIASTGDLKAKYYNGAISGWVRCNARTIGNAVSGASERANADTQELFEHIWANDTDLRATVTASSGNATTDFNAGKTIQLPDYRGCVIVGLDDMGSSAAGRIDSTSFGATTTVLGKLGGDDYGTLTQPMLPNATLTVTGTVTPTVAGQPAIGVGNAATSVAVTSPGLTSVYSTYAFAALSTAFSGGVASSINGNVTQVGHSRVQPGRLATIYIKL